MDNLEVASFVEELGSEYSDAERMEIASAISRVGSRKQAKELRSELMQKYSKPTPKHYWIAVKKQSGPKQDKGIPPHAFEIDGNPIHISKREGGRTVLVDPNDIERVILEGVSQSMLEMARRQSTRQIDIKWMKGFEIEDPF